MTTKKNGDTICHKYLNGRFSMLIHNYGLFWNRSCVYWGKRGVGNTGHLKGILISARTEEPIDFRDQQGVYCLYDENYRLVYVGQAGGKNNQRLFARLKQHQNDALAERWTKFSWFGVRQVLSKGNLKAVKNSTNVSIEKVLNHVEAILIASAEPVQNRQGGKFGDDVEQYLQYRDHDSLGPETGEMLRALWSQLQKQ
ncbi:Putative integron gene cassette protein (modular protein) [Rhodospirillaceae bacterium LM-1]|nr:Putative integron gene cassette protein (modular protein) [Rhodospirillaceae bacterium LM-1]